jgi:hypothetical protein
MREPGREKSHFVSVGQRCRENLYSAFARFSAAHETEEFVVARHDDGAILR